MRRTLLLAGLRDWLRHPWQTVLAVVGVGLGVAVVVAVDLANGSALRAFELATEAVTGRSTHAVVGDSTGLPEGLYRELRVEHGVRPSAPVVEGLVELPRHGRRRLRLLGLDPFADGDFRGYLASGRRSEVDLADLLTRPGAVLLARRTAAELAVEPGDRLLVEAGGRRSEAWLAGLVGDDRGGEDAALADLMLADLATAQELLGRLGRLSRIDLALPEDGGEAVRRIESLLPAGISLLPAAARGEGAAAMTHAFRLNLSALSLLALLCGAFLIYNTISFGVVRRRRLLGSLRCLGASRRQLVALLVSEAAVIGAAGALVGLAAGQALGRQLLTLVTQTINDLYFVLSVRGVEISAASLVKGALLGVGASLLAALPPAAEAMAVAPRAALGRSELESRLRRALPWGMAVGLALIAAGTLLLLPRWGLVAGFSGLFAVLVGAACLTPASAVGFGRLLAPVAGAAFGQLGRLTARGIEATLSRTAVAVAALAMAVAVTVGVDLMIVSFRATVVRWLEISLPADLYVSLYSTPGRRFSSPDSLPPETVAAMRGLDGVDGINTLRHLELATADGPLRALAIELDPRSFDAFLLRQGRPERVWPAFQQGRAVLVSEPLAYRRGLAAGDRFRLPTPAGEIELPVAGVYADYASDQGAVMFGRALYDRLWRDGAVTAVSLYAAPGQPLAALGASVRELLVAVPRAEVRSSRQLRRESLEVFDRTFLITGVLRLLALVVAGVGVLSALMAVQLDRGKELGVLRALGLTPAQLWAVVTSQTALLGLVAGLLAMPLGWAMATIMIRVINRRSFGWSVEMLAPGQPFLAALALAVGAAVAAGLYPAWKMARTPPAEALREE